MLYVFRPVSEAIQWSAASSAADQTISRVQQSLRTGRWIIIDTIPSVGETLAQCHRDNLNNGDHTPKYPNFCRAEDVAALFS
jgi:hypothetical protein